MFTDTGFNFKVNIKHLLIWGGGGEVLRELKTNVAAYIFSTTIIFINYIHK